jgi:AcrR family transcriptional regulator
MYQLTPGLQRAPMEPDPNPTRHALMVAGERLMAEEGLDSPPLHSIAKAAGLGNKYAVQYHFTDRSGLIHAILLMRSEAIALRRGDLLVEASTRGLIDDVGALVEAMYLPLVEQVGQDGSHTFARFLLLTMTQPWSAETMEILDDAQEDTNTVRLIALIAKALPELGLQTLKWRLRIQTRTLLNCLIEYENMARVGRRHGSEPEMIQDAFRMITAAISA